MRQPHNTPTPAPFGFQARLSTLSPPTRDQTHMRGEKIMPRTQNAVNNHEYRRENVPLRGPQPVPFPNPTFPLTVLFPLLRIRSRPECPETIPQQHIIQDTTVSSSPCIRHTNMLVFPEVGVEAVCRMGRLTSTCHLVTHDDCDSLDSANH